jgi:ribonuclease HI
MGWVKLNTDASFCHKSGAGGAGAVARGAAGEVLFTACSPLGRCNSPEDAESKAALFGLSLVQNPEQTNLILETDCSGVASSCGRWRWTNQRPASPQIKPRIGLKLSEITRSS